MSLTRKDLLGMGIEEANVDKILSIHLKVVDNLKNEIEGLKVSADQVPVLTKELKQLKTENQLSNEYKDKYELEKRAFDEFKQHVESEKANATKDKAYRQLLSDSKVKPNKIDLIMRTVNLSELELDEENKLKGSEEISKSIANDWSEFIETTYVKGTDTANPPQNIAQSSYSREDIRNMSTEEINKNWEAIKASLKNGES